MKYFIILLLPLFLGCEKETLGEDHDSGIAYIQLDGEGKSIVAGMLQFNTWQLFLDTMAELSAAAEAYDDAFMAQWKHLNEDALFNKQVELAHDEHQPYIDFENQFNGFVSLRKTVKEAEDAWLNNAILDDQNDPDNHYVWDTDMRALLNDKAQVRIKDTLIQMTRFGYIKVTDGDLNKLAQIETGNANQLNLTHVVIMGAYFGSNGGNVPENNPTCIGSADDDRYWYPVSNRRIKGKQRLKPAAYPWGSTAKSKTVHYKRSGTSRWSRSKATITAGIEGESVNQYCNLPVNNFLSKTKYAKEVDVKISVPYFSGYEIKTKYQKLKSVHKRLAATYYNFYFG